MAMTVLNVAHKLPGPYKVHNQRFVLVERQPLGRSRDRSELGNAIF